MRTRNHIKLNAATTALHTTTPLESILYLTQ